MATRIGFSTRWPERMGEMAGQRNYFPEKVLKGVSRHELFTGDYQRIRKIREIYDFSIAAYHQDNVMRPKRQTIRKNYDFWKSKEGNISDPFCTHCGHRRSYHIIPAKISLTDWNQPGDVKQIEILEHGELIELAHDSFLANSRLLLP